MKTAGTELVKPQPRLLFVDMQKTFTLAKVLQMNPT